MKLRPLFPLTWLFLIAVVAVTAEAGEPPVLNPIGPKSITEGKRLIFNVSASDPDETIPHLFTSPNLPSEVSWVDSGNGTASFDWWPGYSTAGTYYIMFYARDDEIPKNWDSELVTIEVEEFHPYDPGIPDTIELVVTVQPDEAQGQLNVELELYVFNDSTIISASAGFSWDNPNMQMDSAVATPLVDTGFQYGPYFYENNDIDTTNANRRFLLGGSKLMSIGILGDPNGRRLWATYYFTLSNWSATDSIVIDSALVPPADTLSLFFTVGDTTELIQQVSFVPKWTGKLVIKDASDVRVVDGVGLPETFSLSQNYPNPFNPTTQINFEIPLRSHVSLTVYNLLGQKVTTLVDKEMSAGRYVADWNSTSDGGTTVASGVYFYKLEAGDFIETKKMVLLK